MRPWARFALGSVTAGVLLVLVVGSMAAQETESRFTEDPAKSLPASNGVDVQRLVVGPMALNNQPELASTTTLLVLDAPFPYDGDELAAIDAFLHDGGNVVVADTMGHGTQITGRHGMPFERVRLHEPEGTVTAGLQGGKLLITAGNASALKVSNGPEVIAWSSPESFLDRGGDGAISKEDPNGPFPVVARMQIGSGTLWAVALPDALSASSQHDEHQFQRQLLAPGKTTAILVDESRLATDDPAFALARDLAVVAHDPWRWGMIAVTALVLAAAVAPAQARGLLRHVFTPGMILPRHGQAEAKQQASSGWTAKGRITMAVAAATLALGLSFMAPQAAWTGAVLAVPLLSAALLRPARGIGTRRVSTRRAPEGASVHVETRITLRGPVAGTFVQDEVPQFFQCEPEPATIPAGSTVELNYTLQPTRFGRYDIGPLRLQRSDPLALRVRIGELLEANPLHVTPRVDDTRDSPFGTRVPQILSGAHQVNRAGSGAEFLALREYQVGDTMRMVNWKASARSKNLMVNQRVHETPLVMTVLIDARRIGDWGPADSTPYVQGVRAAASIASDAMQRRDRFRLILYGEGVHQVEGTGQDALHRFQEHVAAHPPAGVTTLREVASSIEPDLRPGQPVVVITGCEDDEGLMEAIERLRRRGGTVSIIVPRIDAERVQDSSAIAAQQDWVARLRGRGFATYEMLPGRSLEEAWRFAEAS